MKAVHDTQIKDFFKVIVIQYYKKMFLLFSLTVKAESIYGKDLWIFVYSGYTD